MSSIQKSYEQFRLFGQVAVAPNESRNFQHDSTFYEEWECLEGCWFGKLTKELGPVKQKVDEAPPCYTIEQKMEDRTIRNLVYILGVDRRGARWRDVKIDGNTRNMVRLNLKKNYMKPPLLRDPNPQDIDLVDLASEVMGMFQVEGPSVQLGNGVFTKVDKGRSKVEILNWHNHETLAEFDSPQKGAMASAELAKLFQLK